MPNFKSYFEYVDQEIDNYLDVLRLYEAQFRDGEPQTISYSMIEIAKIGLANALLTALKFPIGSGPKI